VAQPERPSDLVQGYLQRVVNDHDVTGVDELVSADYRGSGHGWPVTRPELAAFYEWQCSTRPDWRIEVQDVVEVADWVVVRAHAGGTVTQDEQGRPLAAPRAGAVEWLAAYRVVEGLITRIDLLAIRRRDG
jgi:hypothetical protein